jgi:nicotinate-nucleotide pyrophosphorylase (carboxylating)
MNYINKKGLNNIIIAALKEDIGRKDITTGIIIPKDKFAKAIILAKQDCVVCGLEVAAGVFKAQDKTINFKPQVKDGDFLKCGTILARVSGKARSILTAERVALNFLSILSGISTKTREFVNAVKPYKTKIIDTRKTIPGYRVMEKYAVKIGGGFNHRFSLDEMILVKDNHLALLCRKRDASCVKKAIGMLKNKKSKRLKFEIEVKNLLEFTQALKGCPDIIMLDNMKIADIKMGVLIKHSPQYAKRKTLLEASGGITLKNVKQVASTGVDMISVGALTHSVTSVDISLEIQ